MQSRAVISLLKKRHRGPREVRGRGAWWGKVSVTIEMNLTWDLASFFFLAAPCHAGSWFPDWDGTRGPCSGSAAS